MTDQPLVDFFRPRKAVKFNNELVDPETGEVSYPPSMTKQSFVAECDINNILKQYQKTGQLRHISAKAALGAYVDLPDEIDFQNALNTVIQGQDAFASLPSKLRARFGNDPQQFLMFMADPANQAEAIQLGLAIDKRPVPEKVPDPAHPPAGNPPPAA